MAAKDLGGGGAARPHPPGPSPPCFSCLRNYRRLRMTSAMRFLRATGIYFFAPALLNFAGNWATIPSLSVSAAISM
jgi:hypothetical protein